MNSKKRFDHGTLKIRRNNLIAQVHWSIHNQLVEPYCKKNASKLSIEKLINISWRVYDDIVWEILEREEKKSWNIKFDIDTMIENDTSKKRFFTKLIKKDNIIKKIIKDYLSSDKVKYCTICHNRVHYDDFIAYLFGDKRRWQLPCGHFFHDHCIQKWFVKTAMQHNGLICPNCRQDAAPYYV